MELKRLADVYEEKSLKNIHQSIMSTIDPSTIQQITVVYTSGQSIIYKGRGIEKFIRMITTPPKKKQSVIVDNGDSSEEEFEYSYEEAPQVTVSPPVAKRSAISISKYCDDHASMPINYSISKESPYDAARSMKTQAETFWEKK